MPENGFRIIFVKSHREENYAFSRDITSLVEKIKEQGKKIKRYEESGRIRQKYSLDEDVYAEIIFIPLEENRLIPIRVIISSNNKTKIKSLVESVGENYDEKYLVGCS